MKKQKPKYPTCEICGKLTPKVYVITVGGLYHPFRDACAECAGERGYSLEALEDE